MAAGKAIVASNLPVLTEVLVDRRNGMLVQSDDPQGWVSALRELASDEPLRLALGRKAKRDFEEMYTWKRRASAIVERCVSGRAMHDLQPNPAR
jgi:glycosyltransferase involved in cell wall biosynthesis